MPYCSNCNAEVGDSTDVCPECGATFGTEERSRAVSVNVSSIRTVAIGTAGASALLLFVLLALSVSKPGPLQIPWLDALFFGVYVAAGIGIWKGTRSGYTAGVTGFGIAAAASILVAFQLLGLFSRGTVGWPAMDPLSLLFGVVQTIQIRSRSRMLLSGPLLDLATYAGTIGITAITALLWRQRTELPQSGQDKSTGTRSWGTFGLLFGGVLAVVAAPFMNVFGLPNDVPLVGKLAVAAFPSPTAIVVSYLKYGQQASLDSELQVNVIMLFGAVIPAVLLVDMVRMRKRSEWSPSVLYLLGAIFLWFLVLPLYLYRRQKVM